MAERPRDGMEVCVVFLSVVSEQSMNSPTETDDVVTQFLEDSREFLTFFHVTPREGGLCLENSCLGVPGG